MFPQNFLAFGLFNLLHHTYTKKLSTIQASCIIFLPLKPSYYYLDYSSKASPMALLLFNYFQDELWSRTLETCRFGKNAFRSAAFIA